MTLDEFEKRYEQEIYQFLKLHGEEGVSQGVEIIEPKLAPAFAERLIICLDLDSARKQIRMDRAGAEGFAELVQRLVDPEDTRPFLAARMPREHLSAFFLLCSIVIDAAREHANIFENHSEDFGGAPAS